jgi:hypothetical protein
LQIFFQLLTLPTKFNLNNKNDKRSMISFVSLQGLMNVYKIKHQFIVQKRIDNQYLHYLVVKDLMCK